MLVNDTIPENSVESFMYEFSSPNDGAVLPQSGTIAIVDDDECEYLGYLCALINVLLQLKYLSLMTHQHLQLGILVLLSNTVTWEVSLVPYVLYHKEIIRFYQ